MARKAMDLHNGTLMKIAKSGALDEIVRLGPALAGGAHPRRIK